MKLLYIFAVVISTFAAAFATTLLLNLQWVKAEPARWVLVHIIIIGVMFTGWLVLKELIRTK